MNLHDLLHDGQAQPGAFGYRRPVEIGPAVALEDARLLPLGDAGAPVEASSATAER